MLVLTRKLQERIHIGENITITVVRIKGNTVRVGIEAPGDVHVIRGEVVVKDEAEKSGNPPLDSDSDPSRQDMPPPRREPCHQLRCHPSTSTKACDSPLMPRAAAPLARVTANRPRLRLAPLDVRPAASASLREATDGESSPRR